MEERRLEHKKRGGGEQNVRERIKLAEERERVEEEYERKNETVEGTIMEREERFRREREEKGLYFQLASGMSEESEGDRLRKAVRVLEGRMEELNNRVCVLEDSSGGEEKETSSSEEGYDRDWKWDIGGCNARYRGKIFRAVKRLLGQEEKKLDDERRVNWRRDGRTGSSTASKMALLSPEEVEQLRKAERRKLAREEKEIRRKQQELQALFARRTAEYLRELSEGLLLRGEGRRGRRRSSPRPLPALVVDIGSGMFLAGSLVTMLFTQCSVWLSSGPRCLASWTVWTRRTVARSSSILAVLCARLVLLVFRLALCSLWLSAGPRAGRYGPEAQFWCCAPVYCRQA